nr:SRPBCC family protein [Sphingomonas sp. Y57]
MIEVTSGMTTVPVHILVEGSRRFACPAAAAWRHVLNYTSWQNYSISEPVAGVPGTEGEVVLLRKDEEGVTFPPYFARTIHLDPGKRVIWKTYPRDPEPGNDYFGFVDFAVAAEGEATRFSYRFLYELIVPAAPEAELARYKTDLIAATESVNETIFTKLQRLVEAR